MNFTSQLRHNPETGEYEKYYRLKESYRDASGRPCTRLLLTVGFIHGLSPVEIRHESLGIYIYAKPKNQREKDYNDRMREKAEALRCRRYESIVNERYDFFDKEKMKATIKREHCQTRLSIAEREWLRA